MPKRGMFSHIGLNTVHLLVLPMVVFPPPHEGGRTAAPLHIPRGAKGQERPRTVGRAGGLLTGKGEKIPF